MQYFLIAFIFLFGSALGSFIMVIANRYNTGLPFLKGRSICFSCGTRLQSKDLFPVFSFLFLRGRCGYCKGKIPKEALVAELVMGCLSVLAAFKSGLYYSDLSLPLTANYLLLTAIFGAILLISIYDLKHFIIPDSFLISLFVFSFIYLLIPLSSHLPAQAGLLALSFSRFLAAFIVTLPFLLIFLVSRGRWIGFGDIKYMLVLGFLLGLSQGISAIMMAFWIGAVFSLTALSLKYLKSHLSLPSSFNNLTIKSEIPFGPFLSLGIILSFWLGVDFLQIQSLFYVF